MVKHINDFILFVIEGKTYGVFCDNFERVVRAVEVTTLPKSPNVIQGVVNLYGEIIPVINIRNRFVIRDKEISVSDKMIILVHNNLRFAIIVDDIIGMIKDRELLSSKDLYEGIDYVSGVIKYSEEIVIICNTEKLFQPEEENFINQSRTFLEP